MAFFDTQLIGCRYSCAGMNPFLKFRNCFSNQGFSSFTMDSRLRGNDGIWWHTVFKVKYARYKNTKVVWKPQIEIFRRPFLLPALERVFQRSGQAARRAVNVDVGHGAVAFVEHVFKVQTDVGGFADFVMRGQIQRSVWALGQGFFTGSGKGLVFIRYCVCTALPVDVCTQV